MYNEGTCCWRRGPSGRLEEEEEKFTGLQLPATPSLKQREQDAIGAPGPPPLWTVLLFCLSAIKHRTDPSH